MAVQTPKELFMAELGDIYSGEQMLLKILPQLAKESNNQQAIDAYNMHERQTEQHVRNLEQCFQILGQQPPQVTCYGIAGLKEEHDNFMKQNPSENILTAFDLGAADKTEYYEMVTYKGLIEKAQLMGQQQVVQLLEYNYRQEQEMSQLVEQISKQLAQQAIQMK